MSYRLGKKRRGECTPVSPRMLPTHQELCLGRGIAPSRSRSTRSTRSLRREALRNATARRVEAERSIIERRGLKGKRLTDAQRRKLFAKVATPFAIAYRKHPELFSYAC